MMNKKNLPKGQFREEIQELKQPTEPNRIKLCGYWFKIGEESPPVKSSLL
jgi:hypothetical protein